MISVLIKSAEDFGLKKREVADWAKKNLAKRQQDNCELSIIFVKPEKIRFLNKIYRGIDKPTSILSFSQGQATPQGILMLGDVVICPSEAKRLNLSVESLIDHGISNLLSEISTPESLRT